MTDQNTSLTGNDSGDAGNGAAQSAGSKAEVSAEALAEERKNVPEPVFLPGA